MHATSLFSDDERKTAALESIAQSLSGLNEKLARIEMHMQQSLLDAHTRHEYWRRFCEDQYAPDAFHYAAQAVQDIYHLLQSKP